MPAIRGSLLGFAGVAAALFWDTGAFEIRRFRAGPFDGGEDVGGAAVPASAGPV